MAGGESFLARDSRVRFAGVLVGAAREPRSCPRYRPHDRNSFVDEWQPIRPIGRIEKARVEGGLPSRVGACPYARTSGSGLAPRLSASVSAMIVIVGCIVVIGAVLGGFTWAGGHVGALIHPSEILTIGGASLGALIMMSSKKVLVDLSRGILATIKGSPYDRALYTELFCLA